MASVDQITTADLVVEYAKRKAAGTSLLEFAQYMNPDYEPYPVHEYIAHHLEQVEAGEIRRLAIFIPPATGKSELVSRIFPAWVMGRNPKRKLIETSYVDDLAAGFGRNVRNTLQEPAFRRLFPKCRLSDSATAADEWETTERGTYKAEGVGGGLIGFHAHIAIIDDPIKGAAEASSANAQEKLWDWYTGTLVNRLQSYKGGKGAIILIMQRWHDRDLAGRLLESGEWTVVRLPSLAEEDDPLGREVGEPLLPEGPNARTREELESIRRDNPELFMATHQQKPIAQDGDIFKPSSFRKYVTLPSTLTYYGASDYAVSSNKGDYTVHMVGGVDDEGNLFICDLWKAQTTSDKWIEAYLDMARQWEPFMWARERGQIIKGVGPFLSMRAQEEGVYCMQKDFTSGTDKVTRARAIAAMVQAGRVYLPAEAPWVGEFLAEVSRFPKGRHDDQVDAFSLLGRLLASMRSMTSPVKEEVQEVERNPTFNEVLQHKTRRRLGIQSRAFTYAY